MSGLSDLFTDSISKTTTLPDWYDAAQKDAVAKGVAGSNAMPSIGETTAGTAISNLSGENNPFLRAQETLGSIASGAANPWMVDPTSGNVSPNVNTALGGLFQAQNQQLNTLLPSIESPATAGSIAGGNFGSLRGMTASNKALTDAQADLFSKQMQAALTNQQTGVNAATGLSNVGTQGTQTMTELGKIQQADPMAQSSALATLLGAIQAPQTVTEEGELSPLKQLSNVMGVWNSLPTSVTKPVNTKMSGILTGLGGILDSILNP